MQSLHKVKVCGEFPTPKVRDFRKSDSQEIDSFEMLIPPLENYHGLNNPFSFQFKGTSSKNSDASLNDPNNNEEVKRKKVCVKGRMAMENGNMRYLTECKMSYSGPKSCEKVVKEHLNKVQMKTDDVVQDMLANVNEKLFIKSDHVQVQMYTQVADEMDIDSKVSRRKSVGKYDHVQVQIKTEIVDEIMLMKNEDIKSVGKYDHVQVQIKTEIVDEIMRMKNEDMFSNDISVENHDYIRTQTNTEIANEDIVLNDDLLYEKSPFVQEANSKGQINIRNGEQKIDNQFRRGRKLFNKYLCDNCPNFFKSADSLARHMESHSLDDQMNQFLCDKCPTLWYSKENLKFHSNRMHMPNNECCDNEEKSTHNAPFQKDEQDEITKKEKCEQCSFKTNYKGDLNKHVLSVHLGIYYSCDQCQYKAKTKGSLTNHVAVVHEGIRFACDLCEYRATRKSNLNEHVNNVHKGILQCIYECKHCEYKASHKSHLAQHVRAVHEGFTYNCEQCDYQTRWKKNLKEHVASVHNGVRYDCQQCQYRTAKRANLVQHVQSVHEKVTYDCGECNYRGKWKQNLAKHIASVHKGIK